ncbi:unnamed protein product [Leptosia nina]|uniref:Uncharacterized protein n=1 Tax=Leptosia nina TaxID=320188 RepID=A0AAV1J3A5_9NEOP
MGLYPFDYCCFCIDLRLGSLIIGYINLIGNIALLVLTVFGIEGGVLLESLNLVGAYELGVELIAGNSILLIIIAIFIIFTVLLLYGLHKNRRSFIKAYLIYSGIFIIIYAIIFFVALGNGRTGAADIAENVITLLLSIYFILVIKSYYDSVQVQDVQVAYRP